MPFLEMPRTCRASDSWTCATVYDWTHDAKLAHVTGWAIGAPLKIVWLVVLAVALRWVSCRTIDRLVRRAESGVLPAPAGPKVRPQP